MRAAVLSSTVPSGTSYAQAQPLVIQELSRPEPRAGELGVTITYSSLCHSDLSVVDGSRVRPLPMALGHEAVGRVAAVGDGVTDVAVGDHVVLVFVPSCGSCRACRAGRPALCHRAADVNGSGDLLHGEALLRTPAGERINHHLGVSAFADYAVVARESVVVIDDDVPDTVAAMFGCAVLTGMGAVLNTADIREGQSVAVFGLGAVGLSAVMAAALAGASAVIAIDPNTAKHGLATKCGATSVGTPEDAARLIAEAAGDGVDIAVEAVGSARVMASCLGQVTRGGAVVSVGLPHPSAELTVPALQFAGAGKRLLGSYMGDAVPERDIPLYLGYWRGGKLPVELLHTDTRPLAEINEGLDALAAGQVVRRLFQA
ncbi:Zn-dependent alcohol dehydrogenase, class III [Pseudarthrobacter phenanthrenivorans Sphe3]|uniref:Zn-dependent alcohol dehydrogenase, class III n=1 Tax=Pseudarthrobacter phenanthrenivorans (strain DSM 18606 / JCM 16027 / LMG 23796 / Sphe3) TaxID=930171 RepID=F0M6I5_PSEPM|nr:alcohol dehydrogenase catalytic domain-containing protein [Pseudarthrobacter phenanthrenivorans]ADX72506.1 Zn-dependent alcohol dehydrogenase, class III [Pseudarthrobacter phenanthrenivorans Sphe3]